MWAGFIIGVFVGAIIGFFAAGLMVAAKDDDKNGGMND